jgi:hypothetical protein
MTKKPEKCGTCGRTLPLPEYRECSHGECSNRKSATAAPPQHLDAGRVPAHFNDND